MGKGAIAGLAVVNLVVVGWLVFAGGYRVDLDVNRADVDAGWRPLRAVAGAAGWLGAHGRPTGLLVGAVLSVALVLEPVRETLHFGQVNVFLMALVVMDCSVRSPRWPRVRRPGPLRRTRNATRRARL